MEFTQWTSALSQWENDLSQNIVYKLRSKSELGLVKAVRIGLGFQLRVCDNLEPMWFWWFGSNVYQMTTQQIPIA